MSIGRRSHLRSLVPFASGGLAIGLITVSLAAQDASQGSVTPPPKLDRYPTPSIAPVAWEIDFTYRTPRRIVVQVPGEDSPRAFWYMVYRVINNNDQEIFLVPAIDLVTRDGVSIPANRNTPLAAFQAVQNRARGTELTLPQEMAGKLLVGEDAQRSSVAIWEEPTREMGTFDIFIGGLSGEIQTLTDAQGEALKDSEGNPIRVRKTRHLRFKVRGDDQANFDDPVVLEHDGWVMR